MGPCCATDGKYCGEAGAQRGSVIWMDLRAYWNYPRQQLPVKWGAGRDVFPPLPRQEKKKKKV